MFFTVERIDSVVIELDSFYKYPDFLREILAHTAHLKRAFVQTQDDKRWEAFNIASEQIYCARTGVEIGIFQNLIRRSIVGQKFNRNCTLFITMSNEQLRAGQELLLATVLLVPPGTDRLDVFKNMPDFYIYTAANINPILQGQDVGFLGEGLASPQDLFAIVPKSPYVAQIGVMESGGGVCFAGRYYDTKDPRHQFHPLSLRIIHSKNNPEKQADCFSEIYSRVIIGGTNGGDFDYVCCVPPRPGQANRIAILASKLLTTPFFIKHKIGAERIRFDLLSCVRDYESLKGLGGSTNRSKEIENAFSCSPLVNGKKVVLLDDVHTTGSTLNEAERTLVKAGAIDITKVVLGYHPLHRVDIRNIADSQMMCACGAVFTKRFNNKTGEPFFGCSKWSPGTKHDVKEFVAVSRERLKLTEPEFLKLDEELNSGPIDF